MSFGDRNGTSIEREKVAPIDRQLNQLLSGEDALSDLRFTTLLQQIGSSSSSKAKYSQIDHSFELNKLFIRIRQHLQSQKDVRIGLRLATASIQSVPWEKVVVHCSEWINAALMNFKNCVAESVELLDLLLGQEARQQPEYWRNVGSQASTKYALLLMESTEQAMERMQGHLPNLINSLVNQIGLHPTTFRSHAPRIQNICFQLLFHQGNCIAQATKLLAKLPFTGKGREGQMELWSATLRLLLRDAKEAWETCCSSFIPTSDSFRQGTSVFPQAHTSDDVANLRVAHSRLALLLGSTPRPGILAIFLSEPSPCTVKVPTEEILGLAHSILSLNSSSPSRLEHAPEVILHASQAALLPRSHICAITFLACLPSSIWQRGHGETIKRLLAVAEKGSPVVRCSALGALASMPIIFNPHAPLLARCTRTCLAQLARLVTQPGIGSTDGETDGKGTGSTSITTSTNGTNSRANKKRRTYEADQVLFKPLEGLKDLPEDDQAACTAAAKLFSDKLYENLIPFVSPQSHDLAQSGCILLLGVLELALRELHNEQTATSSQMIQQFVSSLARMVSLSRGPLLGVLTTRAATLCAEAMNHPNRAIQAAAETLRIALCDTYHPKLPPKLSLRLHIEEDRQDIHTGTREGEEGGKQLDEVILDEDRGKSEREIMRDVLDIADDVFERPEEEAQHVVKTTLFPRTSAPSNVNHLSEHQQSISNHMPYSPDPVKPSRRPSTPRIGSPNVALHRENRSPERTTGFLQTSSSSSPDRKAHFIFQHNEDGPLTSRPDLPLTSTVETSSSSVAVGSSLKIAISSSPLAKQDSTEENTITTMQIDDGFDSDDSMPVLDTRSSDEEEDDD